MRIWVECVKVDLQMVQKKICEQDSEDIKKVPRWVPFNTVRSTPGPIKPMIICSRLDE